MNPFRTNKSAGVESRPNPPVLTVEDLIRCLGQLSVSNGNILDNVENFDGKTDCDLFIGAIEEIARTNSWTNTEAVKAAEGKLRGKAREYFEVLLPSERPQNLRDLREWLKKIFGKRVSFEEGRRQLNNCFRRDGESLTEFVLRLKLITRNMYGDMLLDPRELVIRNEMLVEQFVQGLDTRLANEVLRVDRFRDVDDALRVAERCEERLSRLLTETRRDARHAVLRVGTAACTSEPFCFQSSKQPSGKSRVRKSRSRQRTSRDSNSERRCFKSDQPRGDKLARGSTVGNFPYMADRCLTCGQQGHKARACRNLKRFFCYVCGKEGIDWVQCHFNSM